MSQYESNICKIWNKIENKTCRPTHTTKDYQTELRCEVFIATNTFVNGFKIEL
jgi:hypothetical protein